MAKTFYKYQDREPSSFIDWSVIGKTITDDLSNKVQEREDKKAKIEKDTKDMITKLNDVQLGENDGLNKFWLDGAAQITDNSLILNRLLKSGKINMKDYNIRMQNMQDGVTGGIQLINELNASYTEAMERYKKGESGALELWSRSKVEQFGNFGDSGMIVNPSNYVVNVAKTDKDGKIVDTMSFQQLRKTNKQKYDKFNAKAEVQSIVGQLAKQYEAIVKEGGVLTVDDVRENTQLKGALDKYIEAALVDPNAMLDLLMEYAPESYEIADKKDGVDLAKAKAEGKVYVEFDPKNPTSGRYVATLSDEQQKDAKDILRNLIDVAIPKGIEPMPIFAPQTRTPKDTSGEDQEREAMNMLKVLWESTDNTQVQQAYAYFEAQPNIKKVRRVSTGIEVTFDDSETDKPTVIPFGNNFENFAQASRSLTGVANTKKAMTQAGGPTSKSAVGIEVPNLQEEDVESSYNRILRERYDKSNVSYIYDNAKTTTENLNKIYSGLGVSFKRSNVSNQEGRDQIVVVFGSGEDAIESDPISLDDSVKARDAVNSFLETAGMTSLGFGLAKKSVIKAGGRTSTSGGSAKPKTDKKPKPYGQ